MDEMNVEVVNKTFLHSTMPCAIFRVPTAKVGDVYMRIDQTAYRNEHRAVVVVDAEKFVKAWQAAPYHREPLAFTDESGWRKDYKFDRAEQGFAHGIENPVPLAFIGVFTSENAPIGVGFTNGITRTIWLLANGAKAFPIECSIDEAHALHADAGVPDIPVVTVHDLLADVSYERYLEELQTGKAS